MDTDQETRSLRGAPATLTAADGRTTLHRFGVIAVCYGRDRSHAESTLDHGRHIGIFERAEIVEGASDYDALTREPEDADAPRHEHRVRVAVEAVAEAVERHLAIKPEAPHPDDGLPRNEEALNNAAEALLVTMAEAEQVGATLAEIGGAILRRGEG